MIAIPDKVFKLHFSSISSVRSGVVGAQIMRILGVPVAVEKRLQCVPANKHHTRRTTTTTTTTLAVAAAARQQAARRKRDTRHSPDLFRSCRQADAAREQKVVWRPVGGCDKGRIVGNHELPHDVSHYRRRKHNEAEGLAFT